MSLAATTLPFSPLPAVPRLQRVRLAATANGPALILARPAETGGTALAPPPLAFQRFDPDRPDDPDPVLSVAQFMPGSPDWDIAFDGNGAASLAVTDFGGATSSLALLTRTARTALPPLSEFNEDMRDPRFLRGPRGAGRLTALAGDSQVLLYDPADGAAAPQLLAEGSDLDNALLLDSPGGWLLLTRRRKIGPQRGRFPGVIEAQPLGRDLMPDGPPLRPFADSLVFDFDADVTARGLALFAITEDGFALARMDGGAPPRPEHFADDAMAGPVSLLVHDGSLHLACLPEGDRVHYATISG